MINDELLYGEDVSQVLNNLPENISPNELFEKYKYYKNLYLETKKRKIKQLVIFGLWLNKLQLINFYMNILQNFIKIK